MDSQTHTLDWPKSQKFENIWTHGMTWYDSHCNRIQQTEIQEICFIYMLYISLFDFI